MLHLPESLELKITTLASDAKQPTNVFLKTLLEQYENNQYAKLAHTEYQQFIASNETAISLAQLRIDNDL